MIYSNITIVVSDKFILIKKMPILDIFSNIIYIIVSKLLTKLSTTI